MFTKKLFLKISIGILVILCLAISAVVFFKGKGCAKLNVSRMNIISLINSGDDPNALAAIDTLITDFKNCPDLPMAVSLIAKQYYDNGFRMQNEGQESLAAENYQKSIIVHEIIIQKLPFSDLTPRAYYLSGVLYSQYLGQYQKGIEYFQKVVDNWPSYQFAWDAQFFIGLYYERLRDSGAITASEANPKIEQAYRAVVEKYPNSEPAPHIALKLARENFEKEQWKQAATYFEFYLGKFPDQFSSVVLPLG
jgi:tetratricopeptide (TPR) repeat protein